MSEVKYALMTGEPIGYQFRAQPKKILIFMLGVLFGLSISVFFFSLTTNSEQPKIERDGYHRYRVDPYSNTTHYLDDVEELINVENGAYHHHNHTAGDAHDLEDSSVKDYLHDEVRVLCWIMTNPKNHKSKAIHVKNTWGSRCNKLLIMSTQEDAEIGTIALNVSEGRENLWRKTREAFKYIYTHHLEDADWFYKADDDTYAIVENLRFLLYPYSGDYPIYFGYKFKTFVKQGYMSGGAGYVLSKEALRRFVEVALPNRTKCEYDSKKPEDMEMGLCMESVDVVAGDSRDAMQRGRFFVFNAENHLFPSDNKGYWYYKYMFYPTEDGLAAMSDYAISFHYVKPHEMYRMEYLIYHLRPYGVVPHPEKLPRKYEPDEIMRNGTVVLRPEPEENNSLALPETTTKT